MEYTLIISTCSILVMLFSAYVAFSSLVLQKNDKRPLLKINEKIECIFFPIHIGEHKDLSVLEWKVNVTNKGGITAIIDRIEYCIGYDECIYYGAIENENIQHFRLPPRATFIIDLSKHVNSIVRWDKEKITMQEENDNPFININEAFTEISTNEDISYLMRDVRNYEQCVNIVYRHEGSDVSNTTPYYKFSKSKMKSMWEVKNKKDVIKIE